MAAAKMTVLRGFGSKTGPGVKRKLSPEEQREQLAALKAEMGAV